MSKRTPQTPAEKAQAATAAVPTREGKNGGRLRSGNPGNKGGGRRTDEFKDRMAAMTSDARVLVYLRQCLRGKHGPGPFNAAFKYVTEQAHGKAVQPVQVGTDPNAPATVIIRHE